MRQSTYPAFAALMWLLACMAGEAIGIAALACAHVARDQASLPLPAVIMTAGAVEGLALGTLQALVLKRRIRGLAATGWIAATLIVALIGYAGSLALGAGVPDAGGASEPPLFLLILAGAALGLVLGALMGTTQAVFGRLHHVSVKSWSLASALGWALAMAVIMAGASSFVPDTLPAAALAGALTGAAAGLLLGLVTLFALPPQSSFL